MKVLSLTKYSKIYPSNPSDPALNPHELIKLLNEACKVTALIDLINLKGRTF